MARRRLVLVAGGLALAMVRMAASWACTSGADMTLSNSATTSWDAGSSGLNYSECPASEFTSSTHCQRLVDITGTGFKNSDTNTSVGTIDLYWIDEPFFWSGIGTQGAPQQVAGDVCPTKGVLLASGVSVNAAGTFTAQVSVPPTATAYADGTARPVNAYYGANAVCAVWTHGGHDSGLGNQYTIYPL